MNTPEKILKAIAFYRNLANYGSERLPLKSPPDFSSPEKRGYRFVIFKAFKKACESDLVYRRLLYLLFEDRFCDEKDTSSSYLTDSDVYALKRWMGDIDSTPAPRSVYSVKREDEFKKEIAALILHFDTLPKVVVQEALALGGHLNQKFVDETFSIPVEEEEHA